MSLRPIVAAALMLQACFAHANNTSLAGLLDAKLAPMFKSGAPGAAVIVMRDGETVFRKAYGLADLDKKVPLQADMQLRLGSITKQFTAVAILMLAEQGKLSLQDDITRFIPDYPTKGRLITIQQLLQHKSGIHNYTAMRSFWSVARKDMSVAQMIDLFKDEPLDYAPGEHWAYSNSGYFLLGAVIEKASGMRYADFVALNIFKPLGMEDTAYEGAERSAKRRIPGYRGGFFSAYSPADQISMSLPYAAGALVSTVDDLARWDAAIGAGKLLTAESWKQAFTPCTLPDAATCNYGFGWTIGKLRGHQEIAHGGDIPGFNGHVIRLPDDKVFVAVLSNGERTLLNSEVVAQHAAAIAIGDPFPELKVIALATEELDAFVGTYRLADNSTRTVRRKGAILTWQREGRPATELKPFASTSFSVEGTMNSVEFRRDASGKVTSLLMQQSIGDQVAERIAD
jgi:CubicO group peptidase (beta-lactamase class C family)